jgi:hypothetical protein
MVGTDVVEVERGLQQPVRQRLGFAAGQFAVHQEGLGPGEQVDRGQAPVPATPR